METDNLCPLCGPFTSTMEEHMNTEIHRFQFLLLGWNEKKQSLVRDRHGIEITCNIDSFKQNIIKHEEKKNKGTYITQMHERKMEQMNEENDGITYTFTVRNITQKHSLLLMKCDTLHPYPFFKIDSGSTLRENNIAQLKPGAKYNVTLQCKPNSIGEFRMSIAFLFQDESCKKQFTIAREIRVMILNDQNITSEKTKKSPFTGKIWQHIVEIQPVHFRQDIRYPIPKEIERVLISGLVPKGYSAVDWTHYHNIKYSFDVGITEENYTTFFHYLLWLDEQGAKLKIERYNMENIPIKMVEMNFLELNVPGLAEKRPSLIVGDIIKIKLTNGKEAYSGIITKVLEESVWIKQVHNGFLRIVENSPNKTVMVDVHFEIGRLSYVRMHLAVDLCACEDKMKLLMPTCTNELNKRIPAITSFKNPLINHNEEQKQAIANIVHRSSGDSPFIVYGPPGTGKTITIVEAIYQITKKIPDAKILVCAPSNAACDMLTLKLSDYFGTNKLKRIHSESCIWGIIPEKVRKYSNRQTEHLTTKYTGSELSNYQIVVTTLVLVGRYVNEFPRTHVIIDEAAQAKEPEAIIAIGGILQPGGQLILAGDPKQLGPLSNSRKSQEFGIEISLLERLMGMEIDNEEDSRFKKYKQFLQYRPIKQNSNYIIKLKLNYRSHAQIIHIPNHLFYDKELEAVSENAKNDRISKIIIPANQNRTNHKTNRKTQQNGVKAAAIEFFGVSGEEERDGSSPSYFNRSEIQVVMKYVRYLVSNESPVVVKPEEIGIIAPYIRQVMKIRNYLKNDNINGVEIGTTETFQGREKRVIIISTVRAKADLLLYDKKYNLGFVGNKKRFNVAVTRAMSKLIIVGNPHVLCYAKDCWLHMIQYCQNLGSYRGCHFAERNLRLQQEIVDKLENVKLTDDQYSNH